MLINMLVVDGILRSLQFLFDIVSDGADLGEVEHSDLISDLSQVSVLLLRELLQPPLRVEALLFYVAY